MVEFGNEVSLVVAKVPVLFGIVIVLSAVGSCTVNVVSKPLSVAPSNTILASSPTLMLPSTSKTSAIVITVESDELKVVPLILIPEATTPPVPPGVSVRSALLGALIVEPVIVRSPSDRSANDKVPEPSVDKNCPAFPSEDGKVYAPFMFTFPEPLGSSVKSVLLGVVIVEPTMDKSPNDKLANDKVTEPSVLRNCPVDPSDDGYVSHAKVTAPDTFKVPSTISPSFMLIDEESLEFSVVPRTVILSSTILPVPDVVNVKSAFVGATRLVIDTSPSAANSNPDPAAFTFRTCPAEPIDERPVPPCDVATVSPDWNSAIPVATLDALKTTRTGVLSAIN